MNSQRKRKVFAKYPVPTSADLKTMIESWAKADGHTFNGSLVEKYLEEKFHANLSETIYLFKRNLTLEDVGIHTNQETSDQKKESPQKALFPYLPPFLYPRK